jgi:hypothetical protein
MICFTCSERSNLAPVDLLHIVLIQHHSPIDLFHILGPKAK